ncbi:MAG: Alkaline serine exoprotease A precursor [uncultured Gemmatimonadetes bacterium]|uniref:Alkaline serine exoprotease A n=1 Tax=uncultured Gemmatimonadota bacterium TaxID=203437 RepID=A0A6J4KRU3_9BACT|nr:MAG: Alkaline serine exoprotease A precursor [uncultured Gemmatimonadota bacterium]
MNRILALLPLLALAACADTASAPTAADPSAPLLSASASGKYIVVVGEGADPRSVAAVAGVSPRYVYTAALNGFAAVLNAGQLNALQHNPNVEYVEADAPARLMVTQTGATWGIDRIDQRDTPLNSSYTYTSTGAGVNAYILDTGIRLTHAELVGRANYIPNGANGDFVKDGHGSANDCHSHGTHVAGTIGGTTYGVAKGVTLWAGRVVNCSGGGDASMVIAGMDWIAANGLKPGVVNMSLGYGNVTSIRDAAERLVAAGFFVAVAAGNGNLGGIPLDACGESPANAPSVMTVGSTASSDYESSFSNYGTCVDILAPGSSVLSTMHTSDTATGTKSGTSMATPHVAGVGALYLALNPTATPAGVTSALKGNGTSGTIVLHSRSKKGGTPNLMLFTNY